MTTQDLINTLKQGKPMTDRLVREIVKELEGKVTLEEAANMLILFAQPILGDDDNFLIMKEPIEKLAALVGER